jgi:ParB family transcriptional regulator, chromosome partitioning protein
MTRKPQRRSIVSSFGAFSSASPSAETAEHATVDRSVSDETFERSSARSTGEPIVRVGAGIIGATQRTLTDIREERDRLRAQVEAGGVLELDPWLVDPSPFPDRLPDDDPAEFEAFKATIANEGQKVPVEVRRHPAVTGRYQLVYGHRRWCAVRDLGLMLRSFVVDVDDKGLVIAQGIENSVRQDLSWIEKAMFAFRMDQAGIRARDIRAALMVDDPELTRFRSVCRSVGLELIEAIGRAPKAGRPRWVEFASRLSDRPDLMTKAHAALAAAKDFPSNERFAACLSALDTAAVQPRSPVQLHGANGTQLGTASFSEGAVRIKMNKAVAGELLAFLQREIPTLVERFTLTENRQLQSSFNDDKT